MKVLVTGATGLVGSALVPFLQNNGHTVIRAVRKNPREGDLVWDPEKPLEPVEQLEGLDAVIHLAGENVAGRWTPKKMEAILKSRVEGTRHLVAVLAKLKSPPKTLISASAIGFYGDQAEKELSENSPKGSGFLSDVAQSWEREAIEASNYGIRAVQARIGVVLSPKGGALGSMLIPFKLGLGGVLGNGTQYMSWIAMDDLLGAFLHILNHKELAGAVNFVAPEPVTNRVFTKNLGAVLGRPTFLPLPAWLARILFGKMADELLLSSTRVIPEKLTASGYQFHYPELKEALKHLLTK